MKKILSLLFLILLCFSFTWCAYGEPIDGESQDAGSDIKLRDASLSDGGFDLSSGNKLPIFYHGGKVMTNPIHVYLIWYGGWAGKPTTLIIEDFIKNFSSSNWYNTNLLYYQNIISDSGLEASADADLDSSTLIEYVSPQVFLTQEVFMPYQYGTSLSQPDIQEIVFKKILSKELPLDPDGLYLVITDKNVSQHWMLQSFCNDYCGWHYYETYKNVSIKYGFVGDVEKCPDDCSNKISYLSLNYNHSPNDDWSADGMVSIIAHELSEMITDPELNAWTDAFYNENSDKCIWQYKGVYETSNHSAANVKIGDKEYLIQANWMLYADGGQGCSLGE